MPMNNRFLRPLFRLMAYMMTSIGGEVLRTQDGQILRTIQNG